MAFRQRGIVKTDMSIRGGVVYGAILVDEIVYSRSTTRLSIKQGVAQFKFKDTFNGNTNKVETLVLLKAIQEHGTEFLYFSDNIQSVHHLKKYKDIDIAWIPRHKNIDADRLTKRSKGCKELGYNELQGLLRMYDRVVKNERYVVQA